MLDENTDFHDMKFHKEIPEWLRDYKLSRDYIITKDELFKRIDEAPDSLYLISICSEEQCDGKFPRDMIHFINIMDIKTNVTVLPKDKTVVFICQMGIKTALIVQYFIDQGYTNIKNLEGGIQFL